MRETVGMTTSDNAPYIAMVRHAAVTWFREHL